MLSPPSLVVDFYVKDKTRLRGYSSKIIYIQGEAEDEIISEETQVRGYFI